VELVLHALRRTALGQAEGGTMNTESTCKGPGKEPGSLCGEKVWGLDYCNSHLRQFSRRGRNTAKLTPIRDRDRGLVEARGRVPEAAAALLKGYGVALGAERKKSLYRGTAYILEAFARGELVWREGVKHVEPAVPERKTPARRKRAA
jgi:hypothetical protein